MRISSVLFERIKYELGLIAFPFINMYSIRSKRQWAGYSQEKRDEISKRMSESAIAIPTRTKAELMSKGMKNYWKNLSEEKREAHIATMKKGMKKAWDESDENFKPRKPSKPFFKKLTIERDVPRINTYSGVITESQMEEINA